MSGYIICSVIVPVYNSGQYLKECLDSITAQTFSKRSLEIIIVDDKSTDPITNELLHELESSTNYGGISLQVIRHRENQWTAQARNTGVAASKGRYLLCLDSDDTIAPAYLKKAVLMLESDHRAGWVYPAYRKQGTVEAEVYPINFNASAFFLNNHCVHACVFRKKAWNKVSGQRKLVIDDNSNSYEDWDFPIRLMAAGYYGLPLNEISFYYRQHIYSQVTRLWKEHTVSRYVLFRANFLNFFRIKNSQKNLNATLSKGAVPRPLSPLPILDRLISSVLSKFFKAPIHPVDFRIFLSALFAPKKFISILRGTSFLPTKAAQIAGFISQPQIEETTATDETSSCIIFAHTNWNLGGGEIVLLDWMKAASEIQELKLISIVETAPIGERASKESEFVDVCDEVFALNRMSITPLQSLQIMWRLILEERPKVLFIMSNAFGYLVTPAIQRHLPNCRIVDLLHLEDGEHPGWFEIAYDYQKHLHNRLVISEHWKDVLIHKYNELEDKVIISNNSVDTSIFDSLKFDSVKTREQLGVSENKKIAGFIGRLEPQKQPRVVIQLAKIMKNSGDYQFAIMGDGNLRDEILLLAKNLNNILYIDQDNSPGWFIDFCDILIFPSLYEGLPLVGLEALALKKQIIASDVIGFRELEPYGVQLVDPFNFSQECAQILREGRQAKIHLPDHYTWESEKKKKRAVIDSLLN